jgi:hypothetical protein
LLLKREENMPPTAAHLQLWYSQTFTSLQQRAVLAAAMLCLLTVLAPLRAQPPPTLTLTARVIALGIPGAGAVSPVGAFHAGGPIHDKPAFAAYTRPGRILDPARVLVASSSNFGAPIARPGESQGSVLSLDPSGALMVLPPEFARDGQQATALDGRVQLLTAQSNAFLNSVNTPGAATADLPPVSNPLGISINNGFGRLWFANASNGAASAGTLSIVDPGGQPLAGAPSRLSGGVFTDERTSRQPAQLIPGGLRTGAVATALLGMSPDGSKRAVFAVLTADGAVAQAHTEQAVDGLAPPGTIAGLARVTAAGAGLGQPMTLRAGMVFNWVPDRILYITDATTNTLVALKLVDDGQVFRVAEARAVPVIGLDMPVDLAAAVLETANPTLSSNSTLAGGSDLYVVNRGNGTIMRLRQDGTVLAIRQVMTEGRVLGAGQLNGIAVSPDAQRLWITVSGPVPGHEETSGGALLEVPAFGPGRAALLDGRGKASMAAELMEQGRTLFQTSFTPANGLGPLFNGRSCVECHAIPIAGGVAAEGVGVVLRIGQIRAGVFDPLSDHGGPVARARSVAEFGDPCAAVPGIPAAANVTSVRNASALFGLGLIDAIPDQDILGAAAEHDTRGRPNIVHDRSGREHIGRFGWKADTATLEQFVAGAFRNELGITSPLAPVDLVAPGRDCVERTDLKDDGSAVQAVVAYLRSLPPLPSAMPKTMSGEAAFTQAGCGGCHVPALPGISGEMVPLYSDLLLHDMGPALNDGVVQEAASGAEWRTAPLWGLHARRRFLHDGRATSVAAAILAHDGEGAPAARIFRHMLPEERKMLVAFLETL